MQSRISKIGLPWAKAPVLAGLILLVCLNQPLASVPVGPPVFTNPLTISNLFHPFEPGGVKVQAFPGGGKGVVVVDVYRTETRTFDLNGVPVECHILDEVEFEGGELVEISRNFFAQADDGAVYYFGETVDNYENGVIVDNDGSWLVGGATLPSDPVGTADAPAPAVFMVGTPEVGDIFKPEDLFPLVDETVEVISVGQTVRTPGGTFTNAIKVRETSQIDPGFELKWYAPGVGVVKVKDKGELLLMTATTLGL